MQPAAARLRRVVRIDVGVGAALHEHGAHGRRRREVEGVIEERSRADDLREHEGLAVHDELRRIPGRQPAQRVAVDLVRSGSLWAPEVARLGRGLEQCERAPEHAGHEDGKTQTDIQTTARADTR